jgi:hypothetical protein
MKWGNDVKQDLKSYENVSWGKRKLTVGINVKVS